MRVPLVSLPVVLLAFSFGCAPMGELPDARSVSAPRAAEPATDATDSPVVREAKQIVLTQVDGSTLDLAELTGKVVLVDVWATWCGPCRKALPGLGRLAKSRPKDLVVVGLSVDHDSKALSRFLEKQTLPYPVVHASAEARRIFEARVLPTLYVLDKKGRHVDTLVGELPEATLLAVLSKYF